MSNEELLRMAEEAGFGKVPEIGGLLIKFAALVQRATAAECSLECEVVRFRWYAPTARDGATDCATAIRAKYGLLP